VIGIPTFGVTYTLADRRQHGLKAASVGPGQAGQYTKEPGVLAYYEVLYRLNSLVASSDGLFPSGILPIGEINIVVVVPCVILHN